MSTYAGAKKLMTVIVKDIERERKAALGEFYTERDAYARIIEKKKAKGRWKELYDEGALLVVELEWIEANEFLERYIYPVREESPKQFAGYHIECQNYYTITVWED